AGKQLKVARDYSKFMATQKRAADCDYVEKIRRDTAIRFVVDAFKETLINGPTSEVAGEMASNFLDDEANRRSIQ
ncbi:hypothetical protein ACR8F7_22350, partial [Salmonella enterica subsp. enterica serovar Paratyphi A]